MDVHFSHVAVEGRIINSNMNGFPNFTGNLFSILVYYFQVGDVGSGMVGGHTMLVNCTGDVTVGFFNSLLQTSA